LLHFSTIFVRGFILQVIIVREGSRKKLPKALQGNIVLTVREAKGKKDDRRLGSEEGENLDGSRGVGGGRPVQMLTF
jgi:hypothetical protein